MPPLHQEFFHWGTRLLFDRYSHFFFLFLAFGLFRQLLAQPSAAKLRERNGHSTSPSKLRSSMRLFCSVKHLDLLLVAVASHHTPSREYHDFYPPLPRHHTSHPYPGFSTGPSRLLHIRLTTYEQRCQRSFSQHQAKPKRWTHESNDVSNIKAPDALIIGQYSKPSCQYREASSFFFQENQLSNSTLTEFEK